MNPTLGLLVGTQELQHIVDRIFKAAAGLMGGPYAFGNKLANFKAVHYLRERAVDLIGTHDDLWRTGDCRVKKQSSSEAER